LVDQIQQLGASLLTWSQTETLLDVKAPDSPKIYSTRLKGCDMPFRQHSAWKTGRNQT